ncbi:hypothetical protein KC19_9G055700 [Ceratodon purpureus]|uniref:Uncharacterized protein n=1 Tax=Ceratodon purpureus TaxID=3225 RepID=A0A8T0GUH6_CERPU|nr:hypothetical protein KC19_9G055700 [Ceratodon purpureus]
MENGTHLSQRAAAIQRRNEELERILAAAAGVGNILSVIREGTHEGPTHSTGNTVLTPVSFVAGKIQEHGDNSGVDSQLGAEVGETLNSVVVVSEAASPSENIQCRNEDLESCQILEPTKVVERVGLPDVLRSAVRHEGHQSWQPFSRPHALVTDPGKISTEMNVCRDTESQEVELNGGGTKQLPVRTISLETLAIQKKNMELEKQIGALRVKAPQVGELSVHSLELKQRNEEIERSLAQLKRNSTGCRSPATQALNQRNQELEQRLLLAETSRERAIDTADRERTRKISLRACELEEMMTKAQELDLVFLVDATTSMQFYIDVVKHKVVDIANGIRGVHTQLTLRVAFAPYRDYAERAYDEHDTCDFTTSFEGEGSTFIKALTRVKTFGGGDDAEDVFSGLERVTRLSWKATTRVLVHIADAPCHGLQFHNESVGDYYPEGDYWRRNIGCLLKYLQNDCQIASYLFCHINDSTRKMIHEFKRYTARPGSRPWIEEEQLLSNVDNLVQIIVKNACSTISHTMSTTVPR